MSDYVRVSRDEARELMSEIAGNRQRIVDGRVEARMKNRPHDARPAQIERWEQEQADRWREDFPTLSAFWKRTAQHFAAIDSPAAAGSQPTSAGESPITDPLIISVGQELAMRVWDPPLPKLPVGQWMGIVEVIARCVRECDREAQWVAADVHAERTADATDWGVHRD